MKKLLLFIIVFFTLFYSSNASYFYNSSYTNLTLDYDSRCQGFVTEFKLWNSSDFVNKDIILENYCEDDETPEDDDCEIFNSMDGINYKIYKGPLKSLGILSEGKTDSNGSFSVTFDDVNQNLIEILTVGANNYNDYFEYFQVLECRFAVPEAFNYTIPIPIRYNLSNNYLDGKVTIILENTVEFPFKNVSVDLIPDLSLESLPLIEDVLEIIELTKTNELVYSNLDLKFNFINYKDTNLTLFRYNSIFNKWDLVVNSDVQDGIISVDKAKFSTYVVISKALKRFEINTTENLNEDITVNISEKITSNKDQSLNDSTLIVPDVEEKIVISAKKSLENLAQSNSNEVVYNPTRDNYTSYVNYFLIFLVLLVLGVVANIMLGKASVKKIEVIEPEVLNTYSQIYKNSKEYLIKYKDSFSRDQIYRALKEAEVPRDIIDKVFEEEF